MWLTIYLKIQIEVIQIANIANFVFNGKNSNYFVARNLI